MKKFVRMIFKGDGFWRYFGITFAIVVVLCGLIGYWWTLPKGKTIKLNGEALRNPTNTGITVSTFGITLMISFIAFLMTTVNLSVSKMTCVDVGLVFLILSTFAGIWNAGSLATATEADGTIEIARDNNVFLIVVLVFQFASLMAVFVIMALFDYSLLKPTTAPITGSPANSVYIQKPRMGVEASRSQLIGSWGTAPKEATKNGKDTMWYVTPRAEIRVLAVGDTIKEIKETSK